MDHRTLYQVLVRNFSVCSTLWGYARHSKDFPLKTVREGDNYRQRSSVDNLNNVVIYQSKYMCGNSGR